MIFEEITLKNMFSYYGIQRIDLRSSLPEKRVIVISGRNGFGKTSFINSLNLLFAGVTEEMRVSVSFGKKIKESRYLLGSLNEWDGVINRKAKREGKKNFGITIKWKEENGRVTAKRYWYINRNNECNENVSIEAEFLDDLIEGRQAQEFLEKRLPKSYMRFFFFDGEQIQQIVDADKTSLQEKIEQVLNISYIYVLTESLKTAIKDWKKEDMKADAKENLNKLEKDLNKIKTDIIQNEHKQIEIKSEIAEYEREIKREDLYLESKRAYKYQSDQRLLETERKELSEEIKLLQTELAETMPTEAIFLANLDLVEMVNIEAEKLLDNSVVISKQLSDLLTKTMPEELFSNPPHILLWLSDDVRDFYKKKLSDLIIQYIEEAKNSQKLLSELSISFESAKRLQKQLIQYMQKTSFKKLYDSFKNLLEKKHRKSEIENKLLEISDLSEKEREEYKQRQAKNQARRDELSELKAKLKGFIIERSTHNSQINDKENEIKEKEEMIVLSAEAKKKISLSKKVKDFFQKYKDTLKTHYKQSIEDSINLNFTKIMTSHKLIDNIKINDDFNITYFDRNENRLGSRNFSLGTKQLLAIALLWALKDVSGKSVPVVVDTPLARIDRDHQENLINIYYPNAADQVIILPTDSELDESKYKLLKPYICREYRLKNPDGQSTEFEEKPMYN